MSSTVIAYLSYTESVLKGKRFLHISGKPDGQFVNVFMHSLSTRYGMRCLGTICIPQHRRSGRTGTYNTYHLQN